VNSACEHATGTRITDGNAYNSARAVSLAHECHRRVHLRRVVDSSAFIIPSICLFLQVALVATSAFAIVAAVLTKSDIFLTDAIVESHA
jgi:hypothetical protein